MGRRSIIAAFTIVLGVGCSSSHSTSPPLTGASTRAPVGTEPAGISLTGFGATSAEWDAHHQIDRNPKLNRGAAYLPFVPMPGGGQDQYVSVNQPDGRVVGFMFSLPERTSLAAAEQWVREQLPSDTVVERKTMSKSADGSSPCESIDYRSATLATVLGPSPFGDPTGEANATLFTARSDATQGFDTSNINSGSLTIGPGNPNATC